MVGREISIMQNDGVSDTNVELLKVENLCLKHPEKLNEDLLHNISFRVNRGEIVGIFGLMGAGRTELLECIFGMHPGRTSGDVIVEGKRIKSKTPAEAIWAGLALVPEDRKKDGLVASLSVKANISLTTLNEMEEAGMLSNRKEGLLAKKYIDGLQIKTSSEKQLAGNLSGGNQQKIVLAKWLATKPKVLMLDEPTRGIDINAKNEIYKLIVKLAGEGLGIIMVSSEMPEILAVSNRVLVMCEGSLTAAYSIGEATESKILNAAISKIK